MESKQQSTLLSVEQAADYISVRPGTIRQWIWRRQIDTVRIGRCVRIPRAALDRLIQRGSMPALEAR